MHYPIMSEILRYEVWGLVGGLALILAYRLLTGSINTAGMLNEKGTGQYSPARLQLFLFTLAGAVYYAGLCYQAKIFVKVPNEVIALLGGSNGFYVVSKFFNLRPGKGS